jgi:GNAT superfamily N-acetyltransferase
MAAAYQAARHAAGITRVVSVERMANEYDHLVNCDPALDVVVVERDERVIGFARAEWRDLVDGTRDFTSMCVVVPRERGRGVGRSMLDWVERRLLAKAAVLPDMTTTRSRMTTFSLEADTHATALLTGRGWSEEGRSHEMERPSLDDVPDIPLPDMLEIRPIGRDEDCRRRVWDAVVDAFRDHRAEPVATPEDMAGFLADRRQDPGLWLVAFDGDEIAGAVLGRIDEAEQASRIRQRGVLSNVFTRRPWRRRGLARALVARSLVRLREHGLTSAYLGVDGLNPNRAMDLYETLGFEVISTTIDWTKPLAKQTGVERAWGHPR